MSTTVLAYALLAALANLVGGLLITTASPRGVRAQRALIGFGAGFMLAVAILAMLPHALEGGAQAALWVLIGYTLVHITQHVLTPHFHFGEETHKEAMLDRGVGTAALLGLLLHTFFDGVAITSAFDVGTDLGMLVFMAVFVHKIPEGVTAASIMIVSGNSKTRALLGASLLGASTLAGVLLTALLEPLAHYGLAISAGVTLYVAASNLIPEIQKERDGVSGGSVIFGMLVYVVARWLLPGIPG